MVLLLSDRTFSNRGTLLKHRNSIHGTVKLKRYDCPSCPAYFFSSIKLKMHTSKHSDSQTISENDVTFLCDVCSKTFSNETLLGHHMKIHRGETMKCPHCGKVFTILKDFKIHVRFHTKEEYPFQCSKCPQKFIIKSHLDLHRKQHEGVRYKCTICEKEFTHTISLTHHSYKHRGYPYSCKLCSKGYPSMFK